MSDRISDEKFAELESAHGEIVAVHTVLGECAFKRPSRADYKRYMSLLFNEKTRDQAQEVIVRACVIHPSKDEFNKMLDTAPGIATSCSGPVLELAGQVAEPEVRKSSR